MAQLRACTALPVNPLPVYNVSVKLLLLSDGSSPHTLRWCKGLIELGHSITLASVQEFSRELEVLNIEKVQLPDTGKSSYWRAGLYVREMARDADLIVAHFLPSYGLAARRAGLRFVLVLWGSDILVWPFKSLWRWKTARWIISGCVHIVADAFSVRRVAQLGFGYPGEDISVFPFGPEQDAFRPVRPDAHGIIYTRGFDRIYGFETGLAGLELLAKKHIKPTIRITQARPCSPEKGQGLGLEFLGHLDRQEYLRAMAGSRVFFSPALTDATPVSMLESMAMGLIPVVSDLPALREWVLDGVNGLLFDPTDPGDIARALEIALEDDQLAARARQMGPDIIGRRANWQANLRAFDRTLQGLSRKPRPKLRKAHKKAFWSYWTG